MSVLYRNPNRWTDLDDFGTEVVLKGGKVLGFFDLVPPPTTSPPGTGCVKGVWGASAVHVGENFIKQKLPGTPNLVGAGHLPGCEIQIWKDLGPMSWSHGHSLYREV